MANGTEAELLVNQVADVNGPQRPKEILIDGRLYDLTYFSHPGGGLINFYAGSGDGTLSFIEFHHRSKSARKALAALPNRVAPKDLKVDPKEAERQRKITESYMKLRKEFEAEGRFKPNYLHVMYRFAEIFLFWAVGVWMLLSGFPILYAPALVILGLSCGRVGWVEHEAGHNSLTGIISIDKRLQEFVFGLGCGMSSHWWNSQHNRHHAAPQKLKHDVDLETLPLIAFNKAIAAKGARSAFARFWLPRQAYLFIPVTCGMVAYGWQLVLHPMAIWKKKYYFEAVCILARYFAAALICHFGGFSFGQAILGWTVVNCIGGSYLFGTFTVSHTHKPVLDADKHIHWAEYGSDHTININKHPITDWWMGYLNYQIEHHLFPAMPQYQFVEIHPRVRKMFEDNGLDYDTRPFWQAMRDSFHNMNEVGRCDLAKLEQEYKDVRK